MEPSQGSVAEVAGGTRRFKSPQRILARSFRIGRDKWKQKHHAVQAELEQARQRAAERGASRDLWREKCEAALARAKEAESLAALQSAELEQARVRLAELESATPQKKG